VIVWVTGAAATLADVIDRPAATSSAYEFKAAIM
jgi:hypothetical protein